MIVLDAKKQHQGRAHDCAVCGTTAARVTAPEVGSIRARVSVECRRPRCGAAMPRSAGRCARPDGHPDGHRTFRGMYGRNARGVTV